MKDIEDALNKNKEELDRLNVPDELESRLRNALSMKRKRLSRGLVAAALIAVLMLVYNFNTLAYYGKKALGYDGVTYGSIKDLNGEGKGQEIYRSYKFSNGVEVTLDCIFFDGNKLDVLYRIHSDNVKLDTITLWPTLKGIYSTKYFGKGGRGQLVDDYNMVWQDSFESPKFYEKWMSFDIVMRENGKVENGRIKFTLDRSKAMKRIIKQKVDKQVKIGDTKINFKSITASRLSTVIEGKLESLPKQATENFYEMANKDHISLRFDIFINGKKYDSAFGNLSSSGNNTTFTSESNGMPEDFSSLDIKNVRFENMKSVDKTVDINAETKDLAINDDLIIKKVYFDGNSTCITMASRGIPVAGLEINEQFVENETADLYASEAERDVPVERTYKFKGKGDNMKLLVKIITYSKYSNDAISIPLD